MWLGRFCYSGVRLFYFLTGFLTYVCLYSWLSIWGCKGGGLVFCGHVISDSCPGLTLLYRPYPPYLVRYEDLHDVPWSILSFSGTILQIGYYRKVPSGIGVPIKPYSF